MIGQKANGYNDLPEFPLEPPDASLRNVEVPPPSTPQHEPSRKSGAAAGGKKAGGAGKDFYSDEEEEGNSTEGPDDEEEEEEEDDDEDEDEDNEDEEDDEDEEKATTNGDTTAEYEQLDARSTAVVETQVETSEEEEEDDEDESESEESTDDDDEEEEEEKVRLFSRLFRFLQCSSPSTSRKSNKLQPCPNLHPSSLSTITPFRRQKNLSSKWIVSANASLSSMLHLPVFSSGNISRLDSGIKHRSADTTKQCSR